MSVASVLEVLITGDARPLQAALGQASASTKAFAATTNSAGRFTSSALSATKLGAGAAGVAVGLFAVSAVRAAKDYDQAFSRIDAITNTSSQRIATMRQEVLDLSGATAQAPVELADAFYFLASAGLNVEEQNEALTASAQAAMVGLGSASDLAKINAQALNAYAESGITATEVTDAMVAAVREGTAEPEQFADALGRILPVAAKAGIEFEQVTASLATMSNAGLDVHEGVTAMRAVMQSLLAPTNQTNDALAQIGLTADQVRESLAEEGLIATLRMLDQKANGSIDVLRNLIPNIRGMVGAFNLTGQEAAEVDRIFDAVANSAGSLASAVGDRQQSASFKFDQAWQKIQNTMLEVGADILPTLVEVLQVVATALSGIMAVVVPMLPIIKGLAIAWGTWKVITLVTGWLTGLTAATTANTAANIANAASQRGVATFQPGMIAQARGTGSIAPVPTVAGTGLARFAVGAAAVVGVGMALFETWQYFGNEQKRVKALVDDLTGSISAQGGSLNELQNFLGKNDAEFDKWISAQKFGMDFVEGASAAWDNYATNVGGSLHDILDTSQDWEQSVLSISQLTGAVSITTAAATTSYDLFGDALLRANDITTNQKLQLAGLIDYLFELRPNLVANKQEWILNAIAMGRADVALARLEKMLPSVGQSLQDAGRAAHVSAAGIREAEGALSGLAVMTDSTLPALRSEARAAFVTDGEHFGEAWHKMVGEIQQDVIDMTATISDSVNFLDEEFASVLEAKSPSAGSILDALQDASAQTRAFGADLEEIADIGNGAGAQLSLWLSSLGPEGAAAANTIANSSTAMQRSMVRAFNDGQNAADQVANRLQQKIVGTLKDIENLLKFLVTGDWSFVVKANTKGAKSQLMSLGEQLFNLTSRDWIIDVGVQGNGRIPPALDPRSGNAGPPPPPGGGGGRRKREEARLDRERFERDHAYSREYEGWR